MNLAPLARSRAATASLLLVLASSCSKETEAPASAPASAAAPAATPPASAARLRFTDALSGSGIDFRHHFIDTESGSTYKVNPYDHGSGVLVADVNNDGLEDVYFLDFLGPNQLYLNRGGLRF